MKIINGFADLSVELIDFAGNDIAKKCWEFGKHAEFYKHSKKYKESDTDCQQVISDIIEGRTFPKFMFEGTQIQFKVNNISRICLAQFTREAGIFCSESSATHPLSNNIIVPKNILLNSEWARDIYEIGELLEKLYIKMCEADIPYMDARYFMPHGQIISISYSCTPVQFTRSCASRTRNDFCDEINMLYRKMRQALIEAVGKMKDENSKKLWNWIISMTYPKHPQKLYNPTYGMDIDFPFNHPHEPSSWEIPHNDWRKSSWKIEMEYLLEKNPELLTEVEKANIRSWIEQENVGNKLPTTYDEDSEWNVSKAIRKMNYYKGDK